MLDETKLLEFAKENEELAHKTEHLVSLLECHGLSYFNQGIAEAQIYTGKEVNRVLEFLTTAWPQGVELKAQDEAFLKKMEHGLPDYTRRRGKRLLDRKIDATLKRKLRNLYSRDDIRCICHNYNIESIDELTYVQAERLAAKRLRELMVKQ